MASLVPYARNARTHSEAQVAQIAASIREWGWTTPVLIDEEGVLIAGHGRVLAAQSLGLSHVPAATARDWTDAQKRAYRLADNKLALNAGWDNELLGAELADLHEIDFDFGLMGFSEGEAQWATSKADRLPEDVDQIPEPPLQVTSRPGDLWLLGRNRVLCGDSTNREHVERLLDGAEPSLVFTSPPYAQQREYEGAMFHDWRGLMRAVLADIPLADDGQMLVNLGLVHHEQEVDPYWMPWIGDMREAGWRLFGWYVWDQGAPVPCVNHGRAGSAHEFIFHLNRKTKRANLTHRNLVMENVRSKVTSTFHRTADGSKKPLTSLKGFTAPARQLDSVFRIRRACGSLGPGLDHPAVFPVRLAVEVIEAYSQEAEVVFEPFCGAGSTIIAADQTGRMGCGMELVPRYADVAALRWEHITGGQAILEGDGRTFADVAHERASAPHEQADALHEQASP